jgi:hypothetical protein
MHEMKGILVRYTTCPLTYHYTGAELPVLRSELDFVSSLASEEQLERETPDECRHWYCSSKSLTLLMNFV